jgi:Arc/MetJ family transcription regulator
MRRWLCAADHFTWCRIDSSTDDGVRSIHMKRTNLVLNEQLLEEATRLSGERTYSRTVERALEDFVRRAKARRILELAESGLWQGDLAVMREDRGVYRTRRRGSR